MSRLLLDTSYLMAHFNTEDAHHAAAQAIQDRFMRGAWDALVLLDWVFAEFVSVLMRRRPYGHVKEVGEVLRTSEEIHWVTAGAGLEAAWHEFLAQPYGRLSLVDCAIVAAAERLAISQIATFDRAFDAVTGIERVPG